ncbi:MAG: RNA polymerase sigma factor [Saprospiraceae bacterium]|nr:MAG: RNA polymerase sigma factor [Saprospiraceae bacterium]
MQHNDEYHLVRGCLRGERQQQRALYERYKVPMFRLCLRFASDRAEAEDLLQEGFVKVFDDLHQYSFQGAFGGWVRRVMLNVALQHVRKQQRMFPVVDVDAYTNYLPSGDDIIAQLDAEALTKFIQQLPPGYRAVFNLYVVEGYPHKEIAGMLGIDVGTSKSQLSKAKTALRGMLERVMIT